jgi:hypothetical protein
MRTASDRSAAEDLKFATMSAKGPLERAFVALIATDDGSNKFVYQQDRGDRFPPSSPFFRR